MRPRTVGALSAVGMFLTSLTVYSVTPNGGFGAPPPDVGVAPADPLGASTSTAALDEVSHFAVEGPVRVEGRLGHGAIARGARAETYVLLELEGSKDVPVAASPTRGSLAIVLDQSGSMRGTRLANAKAAALRAIEGLRDGDSVSVVSFDTRARVVVPPTPLDAEARRRVSGAVQAIALGGDTCISCGIDAAMADLVRSSSTAGAKRILLLSDGDANNGVRDAGGFRDLGKRALDMGVEVTTVGVSLEYNEVFLAAVAETSNGRHYFVENDAGLVKVFEDEARFATGTVASDVVVELDLAPGVELTRVFDRTFSRAGSTLRIPVGALSRGEQKTVLLQVVLPGGEGELQPVAKARVRHRDAASGDTLEREHPLAVRLVADRGAASPLDGVVAARLQRAETATLLEKASSLARAGKLEEARAQLAAGNSALLLNAASAKQSAPAPRQKNVDDDFRDQAEKLKRAERDFDAPAAEPAAPGAPPPAKKPAPSGGGKRAIESANAYKR